MPGNGFVARWKKLQVNAEIRLGTRKFLAYLLSPVKKVTHKTGRER